MSVIASENGRPRRFSTNQCGRGSEPVMVVSSGRSFETVSIGISIRLGGGFKCCLPMPRGDGNARDAGS